MSIPIDPRGTLRTDKTGKLMNCLCPNCRRTRFKFLPGTRGYIETVCRCKSLLIWEDGTVRVHSTAA